MRFSSYHSIIFGGYLVVTPGVFLRLLLGPKTLITKTPLYCTNGNRFTCWHQFAQKRYTNEGARIDFTLVDRSLMEYVEPLPPPGVDGQSPPPLLRCGGRDPPEDCDALGEEAALMAATACGLFESGSYAGGGIAPATRRALDTQFVGAPHTGMIYTPPGYSDHVAVSLLMRDALSDRVGRLDLMGDAPTRRAQPHKRQTSISSFFSSGGSTSMSSSSNAGVPPRSVTSAAGEKRTVSNEETATKAALPKKKSLHSFFGNCNNAVVGNENGPALAGVTKPSSDRRPSMKKPNNGLLKHFSKK